LIHEEKKLPANVEGGARRREVSDLIGGDEKRKCPRDPLLAGRELTWPGAT